jgi:RNA polymerase sigma-70 factor (ECF subfamily)
MRDGFAVMPAPTLQMPAMALTLDDADVIEIPSFDEVYEQHVAFVWRTLRSFGVAETQLEDATQDAFVVVHRRLAEFEGRAAITTWLFAIARRVACTYRRKRGQVEQRTSSTPLDDLELVDSADTFAALSRAQALATVMSILDTLDEDKRIVFALVELEQLSVPEVARMLDLNLNTAYSRLRLARQAFELAARARLKGDQP